MRQTGHTLWMNLGRCATTVLVGSGCFLATAWGSVEEVNASRDPLFRKSAVRTICNTSGLINLTDPQEETSFLPPCNLDCVQCELGRCAAQTSERCQLKEAADAVVRDSSGGQMPSSQFGPSMYLMTDTQDMPASLVLGLPDEKQIIIVEAPDGADLFMSDGTKAQILLRVDQEGPHSGDPGGIIISPENEDGADEGEG
jgi:hypothetical protein